ncbi:LysR family transcriptional regulator [Arthrobacter sp. Soil763]|uniref:LysR family transcriptional regulator n=1 Tax=Arthrobacter sp. Soil763 TaxID=1736402 RepID=UPI0006F53D63|nr:LysR family transcriptional regulator [Arthrobacter sp. Soil763]KRE81892.1 LysR family transcriptional regulator [Arthrobacter sp. Soil763]
MLNLTHLHTLVEVLRLGSFTAAGNRLGYTASAVSQQMSALEKDTGMRLFVRGARSAQPTQAAHAMGQHALKLLRDAEGLLAAGAAASEGAVRELRIGAFPSAATFILAPVLESEAWQELGARLKISIGEPSAVVPGLRAGGELDAALVYQVGETGLVLPQGVSRHWLGEDPFRVVVPASAGYRENQAMDVESLGRLPWIVHLRGSSDANVADAVLANAGLHPRIAASSDDFNATLRLVAAGHGAALVPQLALTARPAGITVVQVSELQLSRKLLLLSAEDGPANLTERLILACKALLPAV